MTPPSVTPAAAVPPRAFGEDTLADTTVLAVLPGQGHRPDALSDTLPVERPGPCLPGWVAGITSLTAAGAAGWLLWRAGVLPGRVAGHAWLPRSPRRGSGGLWSGVLLLAAVAAFAAGGLTRGRPGRVLVLTRRGAYHGTVRRTGLLWISPLLRRRRVDVALRHWRSGPIEAVDGYGTPLRVTVLLVWRVRDTARAVFAVDDHARFLREQVEAAVALAAARHPADDFSAETPTLRDCGALADRLGRWLAAELRAVGIEVFSATPVRVDYAPEVAAVMRRARVAALEAKRRRAVLDDVLCAVGEVVRGISDRGIVRLDEYERKALVRDLTVAFLSRPAGAVASEAGRAE